MGQSCCAEKRASNHKQFSQAIQEELESVKDLANQRRQLLLFEDKPICYFLSQIDICGQTPTTANSIQGTGNDFEQYEQLQEEIVKQIQDKCDYNITTLDEWILLADNSKSPTKMKLYMKEINRLNVTRTEFVIPCTAQQFIQFMGNFQLQKDLDPRIEQFHPIKRNEEGFESVIYLSYKPILMTSARDFLYYKKTYQIKPNIWCDVSKSISDPNNKQKNKVRGEIVLSGYVIEEISENNSIVRMYSECDFKMSVPLYLAKGQIKGEMTKYIDLLYSQLKR